MDEQPDIGGDDMHSRPLDELAADNEKLLDGSPANHVERGDRDRDIDIQLLREIMYSLHAVSIGTHQLLYFSAMKYVKNYLSADAPTLEDAVDDLAAIFDTQNIGSLSLRTHDDATSAEIQLEENALTFHADTDKPICYFISGYIAGYLETALGDHYVVNETSCISQGQDQCVFHVQKR